MPYCQIQLTFEDSFISKLELAFTQHVHVYLSVNWFHNCIIINIKQMYCISVWNALYGSAVFLILAASRLLTMALNKVWLELFLSHVCR